MSADRERHSHTSEVLRETARVAYVRGHHGYPPWTQVVVCLCSRVDIICSPEKSPPRVLKGRRGYSGRAKLPSWERDVGGFLPINVLTRSNPLCRRRIPDMLGYGTSLGFKCDQSYCNLRKTSLASARRRSRKLPKMFWCLHNRTDTREVYVGGHEHFRASSWGV